MDRGSIRPTAPRGFRDALPQEAGERAAIKASLLGVAASWGYGLVETPALERAETLTAGAGSALEGDAFRLFDLDGGLLALRPEMTVPIARVVATRFDPSESPLRLAYCSDVYREHAAGRGQYRQFTQLGVELVGQSALSADAECVAVAVEMLDASGLADFDVAVGDVGVLTALLEASGATEEWCGSIMGALHDRNLVELDSLVSDADLSAEVAAALAGIPRIRGGREAVDECRALLAPCGCEATVDGLDALWLSLDAAGVADRVSIDFGLVRAFDYYTGIVMEASAPGVGLPLGGGGRYDNLLARFGVPMPAAGFALTLERLHMALAEQGAVPDVVGIDTVVGGPADTERLAAARRLRRDGETVLLSDGDQGQTSQLATRVGAGRALWIDGDSVSPLSCEGGRS